jgi:hypothetical protein
MTASRCSGAQAPHCPRATRVPHSPTATEFECEVEAAFDLPAKIFVHVLDPPML